jgi:hypothetical protein
MRSPFQTLPHASLPYGEEPFQDKFLDNETKLYRSGLLDSFFRFAVNIQGGPAMSLREFQSWQQKLLTAGPSNQSLAIRSAGTLGSGRLCWRLVLYCEP